MAAADEEETLLAPAPHNHRPVLIVPQQLLSAKDNNHLPADLLAPAKHNNMTEAAFVQVSGQKKTIYLAGFSFRDKNLRSKKEGEVLQPGSVKES